MRTVVIAAVVLACAVSAAAQQSSASKQPATDKNKPITLTGCVAPDATQNGDPTFADAATGTTYRLTGADPHQYVGKRVQIVGTPSESKKVVVRGGLTPSPNVAAQAGAIDPTQAAIASASGGTNAATGNPELPQFKIKSVRTMGDCPPQK